MTAPPSYRDKRQPPTKAQIRFMVLEGRKAPPPAEHCFLCDNKGEPGDPDGCSWCGRKCQD